MIVIPYKPDPTIPRTNYTRIQLCTMHGAYVSALIVLVNLDLVGDKALQIPKM